MQLILQYPEFLLAALVSVVLLAGNLGRSWQQTLAGAGMRLLEKLPGGYRRWISTRLVWAGFRDNSAPAEFAAVKLAAAAGVAVACLLLYAPAAIVLPAVGYLLPDLYLLVRVKQRQAQIRQSLPQALDLMTMCVDAGLGLDATLQKVAGEESIVSRSLNDELVALGRDIWLGFERSTAYQDMYHRTGVDELKMLGSAFNQTTKMGVSVSRMLRAQADFLRDRLAQRAEERAAKLPVWMAFPLWFCIMPALLILTIAPALIAFIIQSGHIRPEWFN